MGVFYFDALNRALSHICKERREGLKETEGGGFQHGWLSPTEGKGETHVFLLMSFRFFLPYFKLWGWGMRGAGQQPRELHLLRQRLLFLFFRACVRGTISTSPRYARVTLLF